MPEETRRIFVLMPFDESFDDIYQDLIKDSFESVGFTVFRSDDLENQQNILSDIVRSVRDSELIVADLTDANPNVYYELGLAHAMRKPAILLSQDESSVPFDLRSYRVFEYDTYFSRFRTSKKKLDELVRKACDRRVAFGSPVSDFDPGAQRLAQVPPSVSEEGSKDGEDVSKEPGEEDVEDEEPGWMDLLVSVQDGFSELTEIIGELSSAVTTIGERAKTKGPELQTATTTGKVREARQILRTLGTEYAADVVQIRAGNAKYEATLAKTGDALEFFLRQYPRIPGANQEQLTSFMTSLTRKIHEESDLGRNTNAPAVVQSY